MTLKNELMGINPEVAKEVPQLALDKMRGMVDHDFANHVMESYNYVKLYRGLFEMASALNNDFVENNVDEQVAECMALGAKAMVLSLIELAESDALPPI